MAGPKLLRTAIVPILDFSVTDPRTGWRAEDPVQVTKFSNLFQGGGFNHCVGGCAVQALDTEDSEGKKLIDDGLSAVLALRECHALWTQNQKSTPLGEPWSEEIAQVFTLGLATKIVSYSDDDDRALRICYNVVKHDLESNSVRWSTVHQKISCVLAQYQRHNDWTKCQNVLLAMFGSSKKVTLLRWIRCAKGLDAAMVAQLEHMPNVKQGLLFDNDYLMGTGAKARMKMSACFGLKALSYADGVAEYTVESFTDQVCKPLRVLEVWVGLMKKRYGSVAENSLALERTTAHLMSLPGLRKIKGTIDSGIPLHGVSSENRGVPECFLLNREFGRCKAGGLPPPANVPTDAQHEAILAAEQAARDAIAAEEAKKQKEDREARDAMEREENDLMDTELLSLSSPQGPAGVIAAEPDPAAERARACKERVDETMRAVHFVPSTTTLMVELNTYLASRGQRVVALVCPETSDRNVLGLLLDMAVEAFQVFQKHHPGNTKFRILIFVGNRFDLISKAVEKATQAVGLVESCRSALQKMCSRFGFAQRMQCSWRLLPMYRATSAQ